MSKIEWTESTWNPVTGCTKISEGCLNCYAERMSLRLKAMGTKKYAKGFTLQTHRDALDLPLKKRKPETIFVNSMSDLFHRDVPIEFIGDVFDVMNEANWHTFQVLTKRSSRLKRDAPKLNWTENVWMGVSVESQDATFRIDHLRATGAKVKFLSVEPLVDKISDLDLAGIDWVIVGGESGPGSRPMEESWVTFIRDICLEQQVPFFFKQWGGTNKKKTGRTLEGRTWDELPISRVT